MIQVVWVYLKCSTTEPLALVALMTAWLPIKYHIICCLVIGFDQTKSLNWLFSQVSELSCTNLNNKFRNYNACRECCAQQSGAKWLPWNIIQKGCLHLLINDLMLRKSTSLKQKHLHIDAREIPQWDLDLMNLFITKSLVKYTIFLAPIIIVKYTEKKNLDTWWNLVITNIFC